MGWGILALHCVWRSRTEISFFYGLGNFLHLHDESTKAHIIIAAHAIGMNGIWGVGLNCEGGVTGTLDQNI